VNRAQTKKDEIIEKRKKEECFILEDEEGAFF
jgi:hypothetical protein